MTSSLSHALPRHEASFSLDAPNLPDAEALLSTLLDVPAPQLDLLAATCDDLLPVTIVRELCASPYALRAGLLGLEQGRAFTFHERRVRLPIAPHLAPEVPVWAHGDQPTVWEEGVLQEPKYYSFFVDSPLPVYNPNYRGKWRSHELLHGAVGFCWHPEFTRFDAYLAARLAELLPVVHWYGWDEAFRARCALHLHGATPPLRECSACEDIARHRPFWHGTRDPADLPHARSALAQGHAHFSQEWGACMAELHTGSRHETLHKNLNASRDAIGYVHGHWPRQSGWSFGAWVELFMQRDQDYTTELESYAARVLSQTHRLLCGTLELDPSCTRAARQRRVLQDLGYRALYLFEYVDEESSESRRLHETFLPQLELLAASLTGDEQAQRDALGAVYDSVESLERSFPEGFFGGLTAVGHDLGALEVPDVDWEEAQVLEGIASGAQTLMYALEGAQLEPHALFEGFVHSEEFASSGMMLERAARWLATKGEADFAELLALEAFLLSVPRRDEDAQAFAMPHDELEEVIAHADRLHAHATLKRGTYRAAILEAVFDQPYDDDPEAPCTVWRVVGEDGTLRLDMCQPAGAQILDELALAASQVRARAESWDLNALRELLDEGVIWWSGPK